jgi:ubiquinone/menaquinone biosynthesis C-methylase UbiE
MQGPGAPARLITAFLRGSFYLLYHQFAWTYNLVAAVVSLGMWDSWIDAMLPFLDESPVLELGFGRGRLQEHLLKGGKPIFGLDESRQMGSLTRRRLSGLGLDFKLARGLAQRAPFQSAAFRRIVATFPSEYIAEQHTIREIRRLLQPGGRLIVAPTAWLTGSSASHRAAAGLLRATNESPPRQRLVFTWIHTLEEQLAGAGFQVQARVLMLEKSEIYVIVAEKPL